MASLPAGKLPSAWLRELIACGPELPPEVLLGPAVGEDACAIALQRGTLIAASDPITLTGSDVGAHAVVINANDVAVCGVRPRYFLATVLLPEGTRAAEVDALFEATRRALADVGAFLVGGHTEITAAVRQPVVAGTMLGVAEEGHFVRTSGVTAGDAVVQVGPTPIEGAAVLATEAADRLGGLRPEMRLRAAGASRDPGLSVVEPALLATRLGASALHDPTEGGLATGLAELAEASGVALRIDTEAVLWFEPGLELCQAVGADPWGTLASGTLLAAFPAERLESALLALEKGGHPARAIGRAEAGQGLFDLGGGPLPRFERDELSRVL
jgi:hydrogenase maturation factor